MARTRKSESHESFFTLDSFMDIVTNLIGALFFILIFAAMNSLGARGKVVLPMSSHADTEAVIFECRSDTVLFPDLDGIRDSEKGNEFYNFVSKTSFAPIPGTKGEDADQLETEGSVYRRKLSDLNPAEQHLFFIVRTDSFEVFHAARKVARELGFGAGWMPMQVGTTVVRGGGTGGYIPDPQK